MWETLRARPFGRLSTRNLFVFVAGLLAAAFGLAALSTSTAYAAPEATWEGTQIKYDGQLYTRHPDDGAANDPRGIPEGAIVFYYSDLSVWPNKVHYIYFAENVDPNTAEQAVYSTALYDSTKPADEQYSGLSEPDVITLAAYNPPEENTTSCNQEGIGWVICPLTNWLAKGMDTLYTLISGFLEVRPVQTSTDNALYRVWSVMRNLANVMFMIGFLAIIYSQITSVGLSNYAIKKMLPRLIVAAVLVNISYWICAIAIDASNILGYSIQDIFMSIRENLVGPEGNTWELINWQSITGAVLAAGAGATALTVAGISFVAGAGSSIFLLLPILVGVLMAVLVALLIMAARQAIITILLVISPLAFVAFLLPNTDKYFEKWRSIGLTMLMLFPIFSVIFGGAQLAGALIIQNADSINLVILGLATQVAPLVITPLLIRFSGSLLGRIAGIINNPNKGVIDRTRKFAEERAGQMKSRQLAKGDNWIANRARGFDRRRRNREGWQKSNDAMTEGKWENTSKAHDIHKYAMEAAQVKEIGQTHAEAAYEASKATNSRRREIEDSLRIAKLKLDTSKTKVEANWDEFRAGDARNMVVPENLSVQALANFAHEQNNKAKMVSGLVMQNSAETRRSQSAQSEQRMSYARTLENNEALLKTAAGIDKHGNTKVLAGAYSEISEGETKDVNAGMALLRRQAIDNKQSQKDYAANIVKHVRTGSVEAKDYTALTIEAAYETMAQDGQIVELEKSRISNDVDQDMLSRVIARNVPTMKTKGGFHLQADPTLALRSTPARKNETVDEATVRLNIARAASLGDTSAANMKELKQGWVSEVKNQITKIINAADTDTERDKVTGKLKGQAYLDKAYANIYEALTNENIAPAITDIREDLLKIEEELRGRPNPGSPLPPPPPKSFSSSRQQNSRPPSQWPNRGPRPRP
jgi:hypothetical protein